MIQDLYGQVEATSSIMKRAQTVQTYLDARFPSFVKPMIRSIVTKGFWLVGAKPIPTSRTRKA